MKEKTVQSGQADGSAGVKMSAEVNQQEDWRNFNDRVCRRKKNRETKTMAPSEEYYLKQKIRQQQRQLEGLQKELKNSTKIKEGVLTERERLVLHFSCMATIAKTTGIEHSEEFTAKIIEEVRGIGLIKGLKMKIDTGKFIAKLMNHKLLTVKAEENCLRLFPPLTVTNQELDEGLEIIHKTCKEY